MSTRMTRGVVLLVSILMVAIVVSPAARAGLLAGDGNAEVHGSRVDGLASIDYAVYTKEAFGRSFPLIDPSGGAAYNFVYAYQVFNLTAGSSSATTYLKQVSVGLDGDERVGNIHEIADPVAPSPRLSDPSNAATSSVWYFNNPSTAHGGANERIYKTEHSNILLFVSPYDYEWDNCTVYQGSPAVYHQFLVSSNSGVPSPVPEPSTFVGLLSIGVALAFRRFRSRLKG